MRIEVGKKYKTRDGQIVSIYEVDKKYTPYLFKGQIIYEEDDTVDTLSFNSDGRFCDYREDDLDLIEEVIEEQFQTIEESFVSSNYCSSLSEAKKQVEIKNRQFFEGFYILKEVSIKNQGKVCGMAKKLDEIVEVREFLKKEGHNKNKLYEISYREPFEPLYYKEEE